MSNQKFDKSYVKSKTIELYDSLPQIYEERIAKTDIRDQIIELNYSFFGYIASHLFVNNSYISYEDKLQSALTHFLEIWWKYRWRGDENHRGYRMDLSFTVFFKPRLTEMIDRELTEVKYSIYRPLLMEAGRQLGKHWSKVRYEDLTLIKMSAENMNSLKAIFGTLYFADFSQHELYLPSPEYEYSNTFEEPSEKFDSITDLLIHDMIILEEKLSDKELMKMSEMYDIPFYKLKEELPNAEKLLYEKLHSSLDIKIN